ncbi:hypothetical protein [Phenylobacterium sp.]|uniref:hypothetical protein n=1 Tax=Phenylobacterium sp. TaxID=1871053 RepID=UPI003566650F
MQIPSGGASPYVPPTSQTSATMTPVAKKTAGETAVDDFRAYAQMTPAEKMRAAILGSLDLTEDKLKAMDPKEREKVEAKIKELIKEKVQEATEKKTGVAIDIKV